MCSTHDLVHDISERVQKSQANLDTVQGLMGVFSQLACVTRRNSLSGDLLYMADVKEKFKQQYRQISEMGERIHALVQVYFLFCVFILRPSIKSSVMSLNFILSSSLSGKCGSPAH